MKKRAGRVKWLAIGVFWLALWQVLSVAVNNTLLLPGPWETAQGLVRLAGEGQFYIDVASTLGRCLLAMGLALLAGGLLAFLAYRFSIIRDILALPVALFKAIPVMAVAIYMLLLLTSGNVPILVCFIMCFPIVYTNIINGLDTMDNNYLEMARAYRLQKKQVVKYIYLPGLLPHIKSAVSLIAGLSWKAVVTAEVLSVPDFSLGYQLMNAKYYLETDLLFAYILVIVALSFCFEKLTKRCLSRLEWHPYSYSKVKVGKEKSDGKMNESNDLDSHFDHCGKAVVFRDVEKSFEDTKVLEGFNLEIEEGRVTAIMGPSGRGKTTILKLIIGLEYPSKGEVLIKKGPVNMLFQEDRLIPWLNVYDNLKLTLIGISDKEANQRIKQFLTKVKMDGCQYMMPEELSGGMSHRVAMARAFIIPWEVMLLDEPFRGLDKELKNEITSALWKEEIEGKTVILVTHLREDAEELGDVVIEMQKGNGHEQANE